MRLKFVLMSNINVLVNLTCFTAQTIFFNSVGVCALGVVGHSCSDLNKKGGPYHQISSRTSCLGYNLWDINLLKAGQLDSLGLARDATRDNLLILEFLLLCLKQILVVCSVVS